MWWYCDDIILLKLFWSQSLLKGAVMFGFCMVAVKAFVLLSYSFIWFVFLYSGWRYAQWGIWAVEVENTSAKRSREGKEKISRLDVLRCLLLLIRFYRKRSTNSHQFLCGLRFIAFSFHCLKKKYEKTLFQVSFNFLKQRFSFLLKLRQNKVVSTNRADQSVVWLRTFWIINLEIEPIDSTFTWLSIKRWLLRIKFFSLFLQFVFFDLVLLFASSSLSERLEEA